MKKMVMVALILMMVACCAVALGDVLFSYDFDETVPMMIVNGVTEDGCYTAMVDYETFEQLAREKNLCSAYVVLEDALGDVEWYVEEDGSVTAFYGIYDGARFVPFYPVTHIFIIEED